MALGRLALLGAPTEIRDYAPATKNPGQEAGHMGGRTGSGTTAGGETTAAETIGQGALVTFSDMPATTLPDKAYITLPEGG
jgi:hypothetical protein